MAMGTGATENGLSGWALAIATNDSRVLQSSAALARNLCPTNTFMQPFYLIIEALTNNCILISSKEEALGYSVETDLTRNSQ